MQHPTLMEAPRRWHTTQATPSPAKIHLSRESVKSVIGCDYLSALQHTAFMRKLTALGMCTSETGMSALEFVAKFNLALAQLAHWGSALYVPVAERITICRDLSRGIFSKEEMDTILHSIYPGSNINSIALTNEQIGKAIPDPRFLIESGLFDALANREHDASDVILKVEKAVSTMIQKLSDQHMATAPSIYVPFEVPLAFNNAGKRAMVLALLAAHPIMQMEAEAAMIGFFEGRP